MEEIKVHSTNYIGTKLVNGFPMNKADYCKLRNWDVPLEEDPTEDGYLVEYPDSKSNHKQFRGYISWTPKTVFEGDYEDVAKGCTFGHALVLLIKTGKCMARKGWNGKGQYVIAIPGEHLARSAGYGFGEAMNEFTFGDVLALKNAQNIMQPGWVPSMGDLFAEDWVLV